MAEQTFIEYDEDDPQRPFEGGDSPQIAQDGPYEAKPVPAMYEPGQPEIVRQGASGASDELNALWNLARKVCSTEFVPDRFRNKPEQTFAAIVQGRALGVDAMTSLREIWVSPQGSPELSAELQAGLVRKAGHKITGESTNEGATLTGERKDTGETMTVTFTLEDAEAQGLVQIKDGKPHARSKSGAPLPWERHTAAMLWHRAMTTLVRRLFPDVMIGDVE
jgi:hypothetical protein